MPGKKFNFRKDKPQKQRVRHFKVSRCFLILRRLKVNIEKKFFKV